MTEQIQQIKSETSDGVTTRTTRVREDDAAPAPVREAPSDRANIAVRVVWFIAGVLLTLLAFRFVLVLLGANPSNGFANFIYTVSHPFAAPFFGLFGYSLHYGVSRVEVSTLIAMAVYAILAFGISRLVTIGQKRPAASNY
jgi:uncharacterized protein YggT (Ycf19 family)